MDNIKPKKVLWTGQLTKTINIKDLPVHISYYLFLFAIGLVLYYQATLLLVATPQLPSLEPDNYIYILYSQLAINAHSFNVTNPYIIYPAPVGFFEHYGLLVAPVYLYYILPMLPLIWDLRILYFIPVLIIYLLPLLIVRRILKNTMLSRTYRYLAYTLIILSFVLLQQTEIIEFRGNTFVTAFQILILYVMAYAFTEDIPFYKKILLVGGVGAILLLLSWLFWTGWFVNLAAYIVLGFAFLFYSLLGNRGRLYLYRGMVLGILVFTVLILAFNTFVIQFISNVVGYLDHGLWIGCLSNPLSLSEVQCLNSNTGIYAVALYAFFSIFIITVFLYNRIVALDKERYEYFAFGSIVLLFLGMPLTLIYFRMLQVIAPYLAISFSLGIVALFTWFSRLGSNRLILALVLFQTVVVSAYSFVIFGQTTTLLFYLDNPAGIYNTSIYLSHYPNSTVLTFYQWGDYFEYYSHVKVYGDTIQELSHANLSNVFNDSPILACNTIIMLNPEPRFVVIGQYMLYSSVYENASSTSLVQNPMGFNQSCGYSLVYQKQGWYVFQD